MSNYKCPSCKSEDSFMTIEKIEATADCEFIDESYVEHTGESEIFYDSSETVGVMCNCGWEYVGHNWHSHLADNQ